MRLAFTSTAAVAFGVLAAFGLAVAAEAADSLKQITETQAPAIDPTGISVSGISSGGYMANQFHIAHSQKIMGAGILAGGPYHCAGSPSWLCDWTPYGLMLPHGSCQAVHICTSLARREFGAFGWFIGPPNHRNALDATFREAGDNTIDPVTNLKGDRVWLFSGREDSLVPEEIMDTLHDYYRALYDSPEVGGSEADIRFERYDGAEHAMIIADPEKQDNCDHYGPPFINDCDYPAAGKLLSFIYGLGDEGRPPPGRGDWDRGALLAFDQTPFFDSDDESVSLNETGHLYLPEACRNGQSCPLHVAFHGCQQYREAVAEVCEVQGLCQALYFFEDAGYNEWAERHGIVVLYPQTKSWGDAGDGAKNPRGCWDWWGFSGDDYFRQSGKQITAVNRMIDCLTGAGPCP